ncbi:MAG TPA: orotidine 5'-phosphate decarboxylase [Gemmatimonadota bacterium]|nr:orotidine 5'-phosphate decarboxylase [Gemmatimonadota bacterium]
MAEEAGTGMAGGPAAGRAPRVVVALDFPDAAAALSMAGRLPAGTWVKVGLELFAAAGPEVVERLSAQGHPVFLDLKVHDIPNTAAGAVRSAAGLGARLLTVHAAGGRAMLEAAAGAAREADPGGPAGGAGGAAGAGGPGGAGGPAGAGSDDRLRLLAVTVLTSLDDAALAEVMGDGASAEEAVGRLAALARGAGIDGAVASVQECRAVKAVCGEAFLVATPGIRLAGGDVHDQKRVATPADARDAGSDFLVVGRAITAAADPAAALARVRREAGGAG